METFLIIMHIAGTILGVGGATMIEVHLHRAIKDGVISEDEKALLKTDYTVVRVGLIIALLSGFGFLLFYKMIGATAHMYDPILWAKLTIVVLIGINTLLLQAHKIPIYWGAGISFVSWWLAAILGIFAAERVGVDLFGQGGFIGSFMSIISVYIVLVIIGSITLDFIRKQLK